jgi:NDP-sugar pyrophosphorylase family protein
MDSEIAFVVMAAGVGSRYNGAKQLETFGAERLTIAEYNMRHALAAGCEKFYFVINEKLAEVFHRRLKNFLPKNCTFSLIYQRKDPSLEKFCRREKPWGTAHAVMCCDGIVDCNFCVTNADDLYGHDAISRAIKFLQSTAPTTADFANVAYNLYGTLSDCGKVSRGVLVSEGDSQLKFIDEVHGIDADCGFPRTAMVSMNLWGFTAKVFPLLKESWSEFKKNIADVATDEFGLPFFINSAVSRGKCSVKILHTASEWHGITYRTDAALLEKAL